MILGPYGTLLWIDGQLGVEWEGVVSERGQRIASTMLSTGAGGENNVEERYATRFQTREDKDVWSSLAIDEETGRIAVGSFDGNITILDYS